MVFIIQKFKVTLVVRHLLNIFLILKQIWIYRKLSILCREFLCDPHPVFIINILEKQGTFVTINEIMLVYASFLFLQLLFNVLFLFQDPIQENHITFSCHMSWVESSFDCESLLSSIFKKPIIYSLEIEYFYILSDPLEINMLKSILY